MTEALFSARIMSVHYEAKDILSFTVKPLDYEVGTIDPGSHIDIHLPNGMMRSYSLSNGPMHLGAYRLTVARDAKSRGGSTFMHDNLRAGEILKISKPRNNFTLAENAELSVFFAGGIGVTPFVPMIARLNGLGRPWQLHYCVRTRDRAALLDELADLADWGSGSLIPNFDEEPGGQMLDFAATMAALPKLAHLYCCGPIGMLDAFRATALAAGFDDSHVHFEYFSSDVASATEGGFTVVLERTGTEIAVQAGETILKALLNHGLDIPYSCEEGICGACETRVIEGQPDHRDLILSDQERAENKSVMVCCSGSRSSRLVLDL